MEQALSGYSPLADMGNYPGKKEIDAGGLLIGKIMAIADSYEFFQAFNGKREDLIAFGRGCP